jgi:Ser/Thr protein kinase RdoA (MazF antagonist)
VTRVCPLVRAGPAAHRATVCNVPGLSGKDAKPGGLDVGSFRHSVRELRHFAVSRIQNLTVDTVVPYLLERNLVSVAAIVEGDLEVIDAGRRNHNLKIVRRDGPSYLIKQPGEGEHSTDMTIRCEAAFYNHCKRDPIAAEVGEVLPNLYCWDEERNLLVLELVDGRPLWTHYAATSPPEFSCDSAAPLGDALGTFHRAFRERLSLSDEWAGLPTAPPWILFAHRPTPEIFARLSPANLQVLKLLQKNRTMTASLETLCNEWTPDALIHNDIKGDNVLVTTHTDGHVSVRIVDWELIQIGDAAWDVGTVFRDFLDYWLLSVPLSGDLSPEQMLEGAHVPLAKIHPATRAFWQAYRRAAWIDPDTAGPFLLRALRFAAARMAQGAYELSSTVPQPSNYAVAMLQLAANILADPRDASVHLFGIPAPWRKAKDGSCDR